MLITISLIIGYLFNPSYGVAITSSVLSTNNTLDIDKNFIDKSEDSFRFSGSPQPDFVQLPPGKKIYFYTTEKKNLMIGPKLLSKDEVIISILNQTDDVEIDISSRNSITHPFAYKVLKTGVLVPVTNMKSETIESLLKSKEFNKNVSQSLMPTYYIKGFKNILIPVGFFYSKAKQNELFDNKKLERKALCFSDFSTQKSEYDEDETGEESDDDETGQESESEDLVKFNKNLIDLSWNIELDPDFEVQKYLNTGWLKASEAYVASPAEKVPNNLPSKHESDEILPDKTCNGEVTLFVLKSDGRMQRKPPDPYVPAGLHLSYSILHNFMLQPSFLGDSNLVVSYVTDKNGDLIPHAYNSQKIVAEDGNSVSFMLSKNGGLLPVREEKTENKTINYYFNGCLIHKSQQFAEAFSNSTSVLINNEKFKIFQTLKDNMDDTFELHKISEIRDSESLKNHRLKRDLYQNDYEKDGQGSVRSQSFVPDQDEVEIPRGKVFTKPRRREPMEHRSTDFVASSSSQPPHFYGGTAKTSGVKNMYAPPMETYEQQPREERQVESAPVLWENPPLRPRTDIFIYDERGSRIRIVPEITDKNDVVIYKLTCKGNLVRYPPCKEPEFGFDIHFELLLDEFILVPTITDNNNNPFQLTYVLQENGDLIPSEENVNTFRKAPGSLIYYMLGRNNILFPVQQILDLDGHVTFFFQDFFILKMKDSIEKPLHFTTKGTPMFAFFNGFTVITMNSKPRLNPLRGSNWKNLKMSVPAEKPTTSLYLSGPKDELIRITPYKNKQGATVVYELDCNGILYRSPKDKKKCIILKSYVLLKEGILVPSNDTTGYVYMMSKNGDMFPYLYPDGKIEAPLASSLKYVLCEKGILLPIKLEIIDNSICYIFNDVVVFKERIYCKNCLDRFYKENQEYKPPRKSSCDMQTQDTDGKFNSLKEVLNIKLFVNKNGENVFYERRNKMLKRYPPEIAPPYLQYTMGSFEMKPDGSLYQIQYQDPSENVINLMLEPNGDLLEDTRNVNRNLSQCYILDVKGNLIAVELRKTDDYFHLYKDNIRVCKIPAPEEGKVKNDIIIKEGAPPLGRDPLGIMNDPAPQKETNTTDSQSLYIPIPLKSLSISELPTAGNIDPEEKKKCQQLKDSLQQASKSSSLPLALELELTDDIMHEIKNWAAKCDKILERRQVKTFFNEIRGEKS